MDVDNPYVPGGISLLHLAEKGIPAAVDYLADYAVVFEDPKYEFGCLHLRADCYVRRQMAAGSAHGPRRVTLNQAMRMHRSRGDALCGTCFNTHLTSDDDTEPALRVFAPAKPHIHFSYWVDDLLAGRVRNRRSWKLLNLGTARLLVLLHTNLEELEGPDLAPVNDLVAAQKARLDRYLTRWRTRRLERRRDRDNSVLCWVHIQALPMSHLGGDRTDETDQAMLAGLGHARHIQLLPERAGGGILASMPEDYHRDQTLWVPRASRPSQILAYNADKHSAEEMVLAMSVPRTDEVTLTAILRALKAA